MWRRRNRVTRTPVSASGLRMWDELKPLDAVIAAWLIQGPHPEWHANMRKEVRDAMPLLARALDRLVVEREAGRR